MFLSSTLLVFDLVWNYVQVICFSWFWFFSWEFCWSWLQFLSRFFRLVGFCLLITLVCNLSLQKFEPILLVLTRHWKRLAWLTSQYLNYAFLLQVSIDFVSKRKFDNILCLSTGGQYFIFEAWNLKVIILHYTISLCKITTCSDVFWPFLFPR